MLMMHPALPSDWSVSPVSVERLGSAGIVERDRLTVESVKISVCSWFSIDIAPGAAVVTAVSISKFSVSQ